jgi:hypothetical protein
MTKPKIVTLCGSMKFEPYFKLQYDRESMAGNLVFLPLLGLKQAPQKIWEHIRDLHRQKIERSDEIAVIDIGGYIGEHTRAEIAYAESLGKKVRYVGSEIS